MPGALFGQDLLRLVSSEALRDFRVEMVVGPLGFEPRTDGLKVRERLITAVRQRPFTTGKCAALVVFGCDCPRSATDVAVKTAVR